MADTPTNNVNKITSITWPSGTVASPYFFSYNTTIEWNKVRPGARVSPAAGLNTYDCTCEARFGELITPPVLAQRGNVVATLKHVDLGGAGTSTVTIANMVTGESAFEMETGEIGRQTLRCTYDAADTESTAHITVA